LGANHSEELATQEERAEHGFRKGRFVSWQDIKRENGL